MSTCIRECTEDTPLKDVYEMIQACEHGFVVVVDSTSHRVPIGIVSEHTICEHVIRRGKNAKSLAAGSVMSSHVKRVCETTPVASCRDVLGKHPDAILVTGEDRKLSGIVEPERLRALVGGTEPAGFAYAETFGLGTPATAEIPVFGWMK